MDIYKVTVNVRGRDVSMHLKAGVVATRNYRGRYGFSHATTDCAAEELKLRRVLKRVPESRDWALNEVRFMGYFPLPSRAHHLLLQ